MPVGLPPRARSKAEAFLASIDDAVRTPAASGAGIAIVVAHPDDETLGCGAMLARLDGVSLVVVTDGAPSDLADAREKGFASALAYAEARTHELEQAASLARVDPRLIVRFEVADQRAAFEMASIAHQLAALFKQRNIGLALTHAYEGGHPDHDGVALAVHAAAALASLGYPAIDIVEMPLYREGYDGGMVLQRFVPLARRAETVVRLGPDERRLKRAMAAAYSTQAAIIAPFDLESERFRLAPAYDFSAPANAGRLLYARRPWGLRDASEWQRLARVAAEDLGLGERLCRRS